MAERFKATTVQRPRYAFGEQPSLHQVPQRFSEAAIKFLQVLKSACSAGLTCLSGAGDATTLTHAENSQMGRAPTNLSYKKHYFSDSLEFKLYVMFVVMCHTTKVATGNLRSRQKQSNTIINRLGYLYRRHTQAIY